MRKELLDHGYLEAVEYWGSDERIVEAARMSTGKGFLGWGPNRFCRFCERTAEDLGAVGMWQHCSKHEDGALLHEMEEKPGDEKLLRYLWEHKHATPFEMAGIVVEVQAPIFVFREWHRHRTQSYNELSARYTPLPDLNYLPSVERLLQVNDATKNRQASGTGVPLTSEQAEAFRRRLRYAYEATQVVYDDGLSLGVAKELARLPVPVARYSRMRASANLRNWLLFLTLRMDSAAMWEIRQYANAVGELIAERFPRTWQLFEEGRR